MKEKRKAADRVRGTINRVEKANQTVLEKDGLTFPKKILRVPIDSVSLLDNNPRSNEKAAQQLSKLIEVYGQRTPIVVWEKNNRIYKGNTTWKAMKLLGKKYIEVLFTQFDDESKALAYALSDNKASEWSDWDSEVLAQIMQSERFSPAMDPLHTGFSEKELNGFRLSTGEFPDELPDVNISGLVKGKSDFMLIQFDTADQMREFRERLGIKVEHARAIPFIELMSVLEWKVRPTKEKKTKWKKR